MYIHMCYLLQQLCDEGRQGELMLKYQKNINLRLK